MKKIIFFLLSILNVSIISAQEQCLTMSSEPPQWIFNKSARSLLSSTSYSLNIFVHIVRGSSGQGLGAEILSTIENSLNSNFSDADIQFSLLGSDFIDNDYYYVNFSGKENQLLGVNSHCEAIDIYVLGESTSWGAAGMAQDIPSTALIIHGDYYDTSSLPHEMGHCLGLYHTHHGTVNEGGGDINQCPELVDGSNSTVCGDYISDTPADPNQWSSSNCTYAGTITDANGEQYAPDASNLMSYAYKPCRDLFSELQIGRMKDFIDNTTILQNVFHSTIFGPSLVCSSCSTISVNNLPPVDSIIWESGPNLTVYSGQNTNSPVIKATGNGSSWVQVRLVTGCGGITLPRKTVYVGKPTNNEIDFGVFFSNPPNNIVPRYQQVAIGIADNPNETLQGVSKYNWQFGSWSSYVAGYDNPGSSPTNSIANVYLDNYAPSSQIVIVSAENQCGSYWPEFGQGKMFYTDDYGYYMSFSPNPTTSETTLTIKSNSEEKAIDDDTEWDIEVYANMQSLKLKKTKIKGTNSTKLNTQSWKEGIYTVRAKYKGEILTGKLVVKK